jgi:hypothetical protein
VSHGEQHYDQAVLTARRHDLLKVSTLGTFQIHSLN